MMIEPLEPGFSLGGWLPALLPELERQNYDPCEKCPERYWMFQALLASMEKGFSAKPNPSVGCVIVKNNVLLAKGCTEEWGKRHAERVAFSSLQDDDLHGAEVYLTLEPCTHVGKQPPCIDLFRDRQIKRVHIARLDPNPLVSGKGIALLREWGIDVALGCLANEASALYLPFLIEQQEKRPFIALKWAQTLDGCLADDQNGWKWISGPESRVYAHWLRQKYDAIVVGAGTVLNDRPSLTVRSSVYPNAQQPLKIIYDPNGALLNCDFDMQKELEKTTLAQGSRKMILTHCSYIDQLHNKKSIWGEKIRDDPEILLFPLATGKPKNVVDDIKQVLSGQEICSFLGRPLQSVMIEGGPRLLTAFYDQFSFDVAHIFIAPFFLGGEKNRLFSRNTKELYNYKVKTIDCIRRMKVLTSFKIGNDVLVEFKNIFFGNQ